MANAVYPKALQAFLGADIDMEVDDIRVAIVDSADYTYSAAHDFMDDVAGIVARSGALAGKTIVNGLFDANDVTLTGVTGDSIEQVILFKHTGSDATARLICFLDRDGSNATFTVTPDGGNILITWNASGIFSI